ncbi:hypothetical protein [Moorena sp. SIOASIH]|uniref:hypothetical protein n=1 Tax=Moorena sp. SIOASIH TaxID=2607817 RepID=UPI0025DF0CFB|nr:hypothetical protein [Moorena sp. SIOASIH]
MRIFVFYSRLDAVAHGGNHGSRSWGGANSGADAGSAPLFAPWEPPRPRCLPKTALHRYSLLPTPYSLLPVPPFAITNFY